MDFDHSDKTFATLTFSLFEKMGFSRNWVFDNFMVKFNEPWRFYHNRSHIEDILAQIHTDFFVHKRFGEDVLEIYVLAAWFHDYIYDTAQTDNEEMSALYFTRWFREYKYHNEVREIILATKDHLKGKENALAARFLEYDTAYLFRSDTHYLIETERAIFREFQRFPYEIYREKRLEVLNGFLSATSDVEQHKALSRRIRYLREWRPRIGLYPGSFDPFHIGHEDITLQAEQNHDKVVVVKGFNPNKNTTKPYELGSLSAAVGWRQVVVMTEDMLTTDLITQMEENCDVTLIRGLRNGYDLDYEQNQQYAMRWLKNDLKTVFYLARHEFVQISSSLVRTVQKLKPSEAHKLIPNGTK